jgi:outer membrane cobalamin receptor
VLRAVPGFTLFRRSSSRTANPGTQGVSMRGVGASGASRALVLVDDIPLNDPFGGWVYWDRVVRDSISEVEVVRGGADASLYGSTAMGGVIQFRTREPERTTISAEGSWGSENTPEGSLYAGTRWDRGKSPRLRICSGRMVTFLCRSRSAAGRYARQLAP